MNSFFSYFSLSILTLLVSCSGYHFKNKVNPFLSYEIESVSIPMFINKSIIPNISGPMTASIANLLMDYSDLKIYSSKNVHADAILIGIIHSSDKMRKVYKNTSYQPTLGNIEDSIGERRAFYIPQITELKANLRILLIRNPYFDDDKAISEKTINLYNNDPKVIFDEIINLNTSITRAISPSIGPDSGGVTNFTKDKKAVNDAIIALVEGATNTFKQEIINAF